MEKLWGETRDEEKEKLSGEMRDGGGEWGGRLLDIERHVYGHDSISLTILISYLIWQPFLGKSVLVERYRLTGHDS